jgi:peptidoglycan LD-endopeptidase LytH
MSAEILSSILEKHRPFHPVVPIDPSKDRLVMLDLSASASKFPKDIFNDTDKFTSMINDHIRQNNARYAVGGYMEERAIYAESKVFDAGTETLPRRFHLGVDIWGKPYTAVSSPLPGVVHSFAYNDEKGNYGATIIITHHVDGQSFHTLYGHLSLNSIKDLSEGKTIEAGEIIGEFGIPSENGHWPPHLHFQIVKDMSLWKGDYPGVCPVEEKEAWLANSPDPEMILQLTPYTVEG